MSSLAMSSFVEQQIVLHQFTAKHCAQARVVSPGGRRAGVFPGVRTGVGDECAPV